MRTNYIFKLLEKGERIDGRKLDEFREIKVLPNAIERAEGSSRVIMGKTDVIVGIKLEIGVPFPDMPNMGTLKTGAEFSPIAHKDFEPGPPSEDATELARVVDRGIRESDCIELEKLCITEKEKAWDVYVDVHIINHDGNLIDASSLAAVSALLNARIPKLEDKTAKEIEIKSGFSHETTFRLLKGLVEKKHLKEKKVGKTNVYEFIKDDFTYQVFVYHITKRRLKF